jgi:hypothetical protein
MGFAKLCGIDPLSSRGPSGADTSCGGGDAEKLGIKAILHCRDVLVGGFCCDDMELWVRPSSNHFLYSDIGNDHIFVVYEGLLGS